MTFTVVHRSRFGSFFVQTGFVGDWHEARDEAATALVDAGWTWSTACRAMS